MNQNNPVFRSIDKSEAYDVGEAATYRGIFLKTIFLFAIAIGFGLFTLSFLGNNPSLYTTLLIISMFTGFISVMIAIRSQRLAGLFSIIYALSEGMALVLISVIYAYSFGDSMGAANYIGLAVLITAGIFTGMLVLYATRIVQVTRGYYRFVMAFGFSILAVMLFVMIGSLFDGGAMMYTLFGDYNSPLVLFIALLLVGYGALSLTIQFNHAEQIVASGLSKNFEWTAALGLMVSLVYIYYQVLRLIAILSSRRR